MGYSSSRSRSRSKGNKRGGARRSSQDKGGYRKSQSRSNSRGRDSRRNDASSKRRNKFSDPQQSNGSGNQRGGFSSGFSEGGDNNKGDKNFSSNNGNNNQFGSKGGQSSQSDYSRGNDNNSNNDRNYNSNNSGFQYTNVRNNHISGDSRHDNDKSSQGQKFDSYNRSHNDRQSGGNSFSSNFNAGSQDNYQISANPSSSLRSSSKITRKVLIPQDGNFNYIGLIIGPKGTKQKQLEEMTQCKILIRGHGSQKQGQPPQPDDNEELHVLIQADNEVNANKAMREIESIIFMDDDQKIKMRDSQLKSNGGQQSRQDNFGSNNDRQTFIEIPQNVVGLVIGKKGETIRQIKEKSGADKVYMQPDSQRNPDDQFQRLIVEGSQSAVEKVREQIEEIKSQQKKKSGGSSEARIEMEIPANLAGLVIGKGGTTLQQVGNQTKTRCQIQQTDERKVLTIVGQSQEDCQRAKEIFEDKMNNRQGNSGRGDFNGGGRNDRGDNNDRGGNNRGGGSFNANRGGGRSFNNRRPRKNADDDEMVDNAFQYEYQPSYNMPDQMMQQQMYANMQQQMYQQPYQYPPQEISHAVNPSQQPESSLQSEKQVENNPSAQTGETVPSQANSEQIANPDPAYNEQQALYQQQMMNYLYQQQMYQNYSVPVIEEVLADGTIVNINQNEDDKKKGKRGGRR